jgi:hypothetical protein
MQNLRTSSGHLVFKLNPVVVNKLLMELDGYISYKTFENSTRKVKVFISSEDQKLLTPLGELFFFKGAYVELN